MAQEFGAAERIGGVVAVYGGCGSQGPFDPSKGHDRRDAAISSVRALPERRWQGDVRLLTLVHTRGLAPARCVSHNSGIQRLGAQAYALWQCDRSRNTTAPHRPCDATR